MSSPTPSRAAPCAPGAGPRGLPPFPTGWYLAAFSDELRPGDVLSRTLCGQEVVLFRAQSGSPSVLDAYCPHLGAHLGHGGKVVGETLRCPFHGFCFDTQGACTSTGYGTRPPPRARLRRWPLLERNGALLVYFDASGAAPSWEPPAYEHEDWTPVRWNRRPLRSHPQETSENSADLGHFRWIHGYRDEALLGTHVEGPYFGTRVAFSRGRVRTEIAIHVWGLGVSVVDVAVPEYGLSNRHYVYSTPTDGTQVAFQVACQTQVSTLAQGLGRLVPRAARRALAGVINVLSLRGLVADSGQDFPIWENKRFIHPPALAEGDGPVGRFRQWARQFYPEARAEQAEARRSA